MNGNTAELVRLLGDAIVHMHVHDNHGQRDEHLPMGRGTIDFSVLAPVLARFDGMAIAEVVWEEGRSQDSPETLARAAQDAWAKVQSAR